jgi:hypothetical protein
MNSKRQYAIAIPAIFRGKESPPGHNYTEGGSDNTSDMQRYVRSNNPPPSSQRRRSGRVMKSPTVSHSRHSRHDQSAVEPRAIPTSWNQSSPRSLPASIGLEPNYVTGGTGYANLGQPNIAQPGRCWGAGGRLSSGNSRLEEDADPDAQGYDDEAAAAELFLAIQQESSDRAV